MLPALAVGGWLVTGGVAALTVIVTVAGGLWAPWLSVVIKVKVYVPAVRVTVVDAAVAGDGVGVPLQRYETMLPSGSLPLPLRVTRRDVSPELRVMV